MKANGHVSLVGAGPGDPDLLTVRALRRIQEAEVLVHDRLVPSAITALAGPGTRMISVGKKAGFHPVPQDEINALLIALAREGRKVVRLKGGDPFIFGRGSEEAAVLRDAGIAVEVVPGITAAQGMAASTGVPLTHRGLATGVRYVTGHRKADEPLDLNWQSLADPNTTLVVYMGAANIAEIARNLIAAGMPEQLPVLAVARATTPDEVRLSSTLERIGRDAVGQGLPTPVLFVIGHVASMIDDITCGLLCEATVHNDMIPGRAHA